MTRVTDPTESRRRTPGPRTASLMVQALALRPHEVFEGPVAVRRCEVPAGEYVRAAGKPHPAGITQDPYCRCPVTRVGGNLRSRHQHMWIPAHSARTAGDRHSREPDRLLRIFLRCGHMREGRVGVVGHPHFIRAAGKLLAGLVLPSGDVQRYRYEVRKGPFDPGRRGQAHLRHASLPSGPNLKPSHPCWLPARLGRASAPPFPRSGALRYRRNLWIM